ncbi:MAG: ADOP family duplicated permease [Acidobacteriota bacterium]
MLKSARNFLQKRRAEQALDEELRSCVDLLTEEKMQRGVGQAEARRQALIELGGVEQVKEEVRAVRGLPFLEAMIRDVRFGLRNLVRAPGFTVAVILTLGLALGANAAVFALLDRLVLRPLPVKEPAALVIVSAPPIPTRSRLTVMFVTRGGVKGVSYPLYVALRDRLNVFEGMLAEFHVTATVLAGGEPFMAGGVVATDNYFEALGVRPVLGRVFGPGEDRAHGHSPVVVISHGLWQRQFGGDRSILNKTIRLNQLPMTVIGVTPPGFTGTVAGDTSDFFTLLSARDKLIGSRFRYDSPDFNIYKLVARLAPGVAQEQAEHVADGVYRQLLADAVGDGARTEKSRARFASQHLTLSPGGYASNDQSALGRDLKTPLQLLMAMVSLVLIVAAGNVGNLFLARGEARARETAIRFALGSTRWRVLRQSLLESLMLALGAGLFGLLLAHWTSSLAPVLLDVETLPEGVTSAPDHRAGAVTLGLALVAGLVIWAASAVHAVRRGSSCSLIQQVKIAGRRPGFHWRRVLVAAQIALSIVLLCASAVLSRSLIKLMRVDTGFPVENLYSFSLNPGQAGYGSSQSGAFLLSVLDRLSRIPGVASASITSQLPLSAGGSGGFVIADATDAPHEVGADIIAEVGAGYFRSLGMPVVAGREFTSDDGTGSLKVALLNESLARLLFDHSNPLGRRVGFQGGPPDMQVVGIVKDTRSNSRAAVRPSLFRPYNFKEPPNNQAAFVVRVARSGSLSSDAVRTVVRGIDPAVAVTEFTSMTERTSRLLYRDRMLASVSLCFAALAAILCGIGIFGLTSFSVAHRSQEIGLRIALGATRGSIQWLVMREVSWLAAAGCAGGLVAFITFNRVLSSVLFQLTPDDPASLVVGALVLGGTAFAAGFLPAWRAARLDPAFILRQE